MWTYIQTSGVLSHNGQQDGSGYSGHGDGINNPAMQSVSNVGPIPQGQWTIGEGVNDPKLGPVAMPLRRTLVQRPSDEVASLYTATR